MRVVFDANIYVSALLAQQGNPAQLFASWEQDKFELAISPPILEEIDRVIHYPRIRKKYKLPEEGVLAFLQGISSAAFVVEPTTELSVIERDPSDNRILECALAGNANFIVTGDNHLLALREFQGIFILTPASFLALLMLDEQK